MSFTVLDNYEGFVINNFIKKDLKQTKLLKNISLTWNEFNKSNIHNIIAERKREMHKKDKTNIIKIKKISMFENFTHK